MLLRYDEDEHRSRETPFAVAYNSIDAQDSHKVTKWPIPSKDLPPRANQAYIKYCRRGI